MEEIKKKSTRGGSREGSGRKKIEHGKPYAFQSYPAVDEILSNYHGNKTKFINDAIEYYWNSLQK